MKVGDLVEDDFYEEVGIVISGPRLSEDWDHVSFGTMSGDVYHVVDVLCSNGRLRLFTTDEIKVISEGRGLS